MPADIIPIKRLAFGTFLMDPAWRYDNTSSRAAAENHYQTMPTEEILQLPIPEVAAESAHLYLWTTAAHQEIAFGLMRYWGFTFKQEIPWVKTKDIETQIVEKMVDGQVIKKVEHVIAPAVRTEIQAGKRETISLQIGMGNYFRHCTEVCLFGAKGPGAGLVHNLPNVVFAPRGEHSAKPAIYHELAELMSPGPRLELFARRERDDWWVWGNQVPVREELAKIIPIRAI